LKAPRSAKSIRHFQRAYKQDPTEDKVKILFTTTLQLSAKVLVLEHQNKGLNKAIDMQKKKNKKGVWVNLLGDPNKDIVDCYSPAACVKMREYAEVKEAEKEAEEKRKYNNRVKRAANALKRAKEKEEKEARAAARQLMADLKKANQSSKKAPKAQPKSVGTKAKTAALTMSKSRKAPVRAKLPPKSPAKRVVEAPVEEVVASGVAVTKRSNRAIKLPARYT
jgi:hypothetical protein